MRILTVLLAFSAAIPTLSQDPKALVLEVVEAVGGSQRLYQLRDVEYRYTYMDSKSGNRDVSLERYVFDGELSWARFEEMDNALAGVEGTLVQGFDGQKAWASLNGALVSDPKLIGMSNFLRKTNYYWFAMMFKLADPGLTYDYMGQRKVEGIAYDVVKIGFEANVGDVQDTYILYINPYTKLVDQFLFTVLDFGRTDPLIMRVIYQEVDGLVLPTVRRLCPADWEGNPQGDSWGLEIMENIRFNQGFERSLFEAPQP